MKYRSLNTTSLTHLPILKVRDGDYERFITGGVHDFYILGDDGGLHYLNIQGMYGTENEEDVNLVADYDPDWGFKYFEKVNSLGLMNIDAKRFGVENDSEFIKLKEQVENYFDRAIEAYDYRINWMLNQVLSNDEENKQRS